MKPKDVLKSALRSAIEYERGYLATIRNQNGFTAERDKRYAADELPINPVAPPAVGQRIRCALPMREHPDMTCSRERGHREHDGSSCFYQTDAARKDTGGTGVVHDKEDSDGSTTL